MSGAFLLYDYQQNNTMKSDTPALLLSGNGI
jgi:hypothetical protein